MPFFAENRELVTPGTLLAKGDYRPGEHVYKRGDCIYATHTGLVEYSEDIVNVIALVGTYIPKVDDLIVGKVVKTQFSYCEMDINSPYTAKLRVAEARRRFDLSKTAQKLFPPGTIVVGKIVEFDRTKDPVVTIRGRGLGVVRGGRVISITPTKVPRVIGRGGSMIKMLLERTGCQITVGQNGTIVVRGERPREEEIAIFAIKKIEREAHTSGLTIRVSAMIDKEMAR